MMSAQSRATRSLAAARLHLATEKSDDDYANRSKSPQYDAERHAARPIQQTLQPQLPSSMPKNILNPELFSNYLRPCAAHLCDGAFFVVRIEVDGARGVAQDAHFEPFAQRVERRMLDAVIGR